MTTKSSQSGFVALFASRTLANVLKVFVIDPDREYYQRELQRVTGAHLRQLQRDLARLEESGLVVKRVSGNRSYYRARRSHPAFDDLRSAIVKTVGLGDVLRSALRHQAAGITAAFVFGSFARGEEGAESDVDLFVLGSVTRRALAGVLAATSRELGREVNLIILTPAEFARRRRAGDHFVTAVLSEPRIWIVGDKHALAAPG